MEWSCAACGTSWPTTYSFCAFCGQARAAVDTSSAEIDDVLRALVGDQLRTELVSRGGKLPEERRLVSAVFADLSGFTPLAGRLDPEALAEVVDPILAALVRIVKRGDGHVGSFAGDALLAYFGAPVAHEDDAARAVRCAQEMLAEFPALLAAAPDEAAGLSLRIGIDTGAVMARLVAGDIRTDYNILGNSVNMAQRLQSNAPPGGCVVGETTFDLTKDAFDFDHLGGLQVKGRAEPLPAWLLVGDRAPAVQRRRRRTSRMVGREAELAALARVEADGGALLLIAEAGAGKSRLLEESRSRSVRAWLEGGCAPHDSTTSFRPWVGALAGVSSGSDGLRVLRGDPDAALAALPPAQRRDLVARDVASTLASLAPVVVVLEDLHWADQASLDLLDDLLHMLPSSVTVLASSREPLSLTATVDALDLQPLVADDVAALVSDLLEGDPPTVLVHDIVRRCGGNPLYVAELALAMRERGLVEKLDGEVLVASASALEGGALDLVPNSLEGLIGARIDALPNAEERVLTIAAVLGAPVSADLISAVSIRLALPHQEIGAAIDGLRAARILDGGRFVHAVVQNTAYMRTTRARRRTLHLAAADSCHPLIAAEEQAGFLARHLYLAGAGPRAVDALEAAADQALELGRHDEAVLHLRREVELRLGSSASAAQREAAPQRRVVLGELLALLGRDSEAEPELRATGSLGHRTLVGCLRRMGRFEEALQLADQALADRPADPEVRDWAREEQGWSLAALGDLDGAVARLGSEASGVAAARHDLVRCYCLIERGEWAIAESALVGAIATLDEAGDLAATARGHRLLGQVVGRLGRSEEGRDILDRGVALARAAGAAEEVAACLNNLVIFAQRTGEMSTAIGWAEDAVRQSDRMRHQFGRAVTRNNLAAALTEAGDHDRAIAVASHAIELATASRLDGLVGAILHTRGCARLARGDLAGALADAEASLPLVAGSEDEEGTMSLLAEVSQAMTGPSSDPPPV